jgi:trehalose synthase
VALPTTALESVSLPQRSLSDYRGIVDDAVIDEAVSLGQKLRGVRVLQLSSTATGGGVAELLNSLAPLEADCGLAVEWRLLCPDEQLFTVTKGFHNALQGQDSSLDELGKQTYLQHNAHCAAMLESDAYDVIIVHDPQPAAVPHFAAMSRSKYA